MGGTQTKPSDKAESPRVAAEAEDSGLPGKEKTPEGGQQSQNKKESDAVDGSSTHVTGDTADESPRPRQPEDEPEAAETKLPQDEPEAAETKLPQDELVSECGADNGGTGVLEKQGAAVPKIPDKRTQQLLERLYEHQTTQPDAVALEHDGVVEFTYSTLATAVGGLAHRLLEAGVCCEDPVALHLLRSPQWVVAALGTWAAGGAVLPLDPMLPVARRAELVARGTPKVVVGEPWPDLSHVLVMGPPMPLKACRKDPDSLAWLIFSSGSTGEPKGVMVEHRAYGDVLHDQVEALSLTSKDREAWLLSPQFDASLSDIGVAIYAGATLCTDSRQLLESLPDLRSHLIAQRITYADLPPRLLEILEPDDLPDLRVVLCGGEPLPPAGAKKWAESRCVIGVYGPTEATICTSLWTVSPSDVEDPFIGQPVGGAILRVENEELWIGGPGVARGYLNDPALTEKRFVVDDNGVRWHRTGDCVKKRADGLLVFAGRIDRQCKVDGRLMCPEEVERALVEMKGVTAAAVLVRELSGVNVVHACVEATSESELDSTHCSAHVSSMLPSWMVPQKWCFGPMPRTTTGKPDLTALSEIFDVEADGSAPLDDAVLDSLASLVAGILGSNGKHLSETESLASIGLDSLRTLQLSAALATSGLKISPQQIRSAGTLEGIRKLAASRKPPSVPADDLIASAENLATDIISGLTTTFSVAHFSGPVLLTGATGGMGARVLACLLHRGLSVLALVRANDESAAFSRLSDTFDRYSLSSELLRSDRLAVVCGDLGALTSEGGGPLGSLLNSKPWSGVIHLAADLNLTADATKLWQTNVTATAGLLSLALSRGRMPVLFASTLSVFVDTDIIASDFTEDMPAPRGVNVIGGYAQSKLAAEALVEKVGELSPSLPHLVVRYGLLVGDSNTGRSAPADWFAKVVRGFRYLGALPDVGRQQSLAFDVTPADEAAEATVDLWLRVVDGGKLPPRAHIAAPAPSTINDLACAFEAEGVPLSVVSEEDFRAKVSAATADAGHVDEAAATLALADVVAPAKVSDGFLHALNLFRATGVQFGGTATSEALGRPAVKATTIEQLRHLVRAALE